MEISKETRKRMMQIIAFGILLYCGMEHFDVVIGAVDFVLGIVMPFLVGGAIAFVINVPMKSIERHLFAKNGKLAKWRRPVAYLLTLALVIGIITLALVVVIPELGNTISMIVQQVPVPVVSLQVHRCPRFNTALDDPLHQGRRIDTANHAVGNRRCGKYVRAVLQFVRDDQITDPFPRKGQGLAVGIADDGVIIKPCHIRHLHAVISQLAVRFI